ncbi:MAG: hypothetical protein ACLFQX_09595 [Candidatus Kapaibacterium sp.]
MAVFSETILTRDDKQTILKKANDAGFGMKLECPDGLISLLPGVRIRWFGMARHHKLGEVGQFQLKLKKDSIDALPDDHPVIRFLQSLTEPVAVCAGCRNADINRSLIARGALFGNLPDM